MATENSFSRTRRCDPWNKGRLIGQKRPLKPKDVWTIRVRLQLEERKRDLAMFSLTINSKLRGCNLVRLKLNDVCAGGSVRNRAAVIQKTGRLVQFELTEQTQGSSVRAVQRRHRGRMTPPAVCPAGRVIGSPYGDDALQDLYRSQIGGCKRGRGHGRCRGACRL